MSLYNKPISVIEDYSYKLDKNGIPIELPLLTTEEINLLLKYKVCDKFEKDSVLKFKFVGVITLPDNIIVSLPKNYTTHNTNVMKDIIKTFKSYKNSSNAKNSINENNLGELYLNDDLSDCSVSEISIADYIISDFINNGLYHNVYSELILDGNGDPYWQYTVENIDPLISNGYPIYTSTYNIEVLLDKTNKITEFHKWAINYCIEKYGKFLDYDINTIDNKYSSYEAIGSYNELLYLIESELHNTFESRKIDLLKALNNLLNKSFGYCNGNSISLYGTSKFDTIWEYILQVVFKDEYYDDKFKNKYDRDIFKPKWKDINNNTWLATPIKPDIVRQVDKTLFILDAKYYDINFDYSKDNKLQVSGQPNSYDIIKQTYYKVKLAEKFSKLHSIGIFKYVNCFIYPLKDTNNHNYSNIDNDKYFDESFKILGTVSIDEPIINIQVDLNYLLYRFKSNSPLSNDEMNKLENKIISETLKITSI